VEAHGDDQLGPAQDCGEESGWDAGGQDAGAAGEAAPRRQLLAHWRIESLMEWHHEDGQIQGGGHLLENLSECLQVGSAP
jgi:hypothetical protein